MATASCENILGSDGQQKKKEKQTDGTRRTQQAIALSDQMLIDPVHFKIETPEGTMGICGVSKESARRSGLRGFGVTPPRVCVYTYSRQRKPTRLGRHQGHGSVVLWT
jgi:hypothetical protein